MNNRILFRRLIIGCTVAQILWQVLPWLEWRMVSGDVAAVLSWYGVGAILPLPTHVVWLCVILYLPTAMGLYQFAHQARWLFVALTVFLHGWQLLSGVQVETPIGSFLRSFVILGHGAIIALAFTAPLKQIFESTDDSAA